MVSDVSTGVSELDEQLGGGIAPGSLVTIRADPASQAELFLYRAAATANDACYITTARSKRAIEETLDSQPFLVRSTTIRAADDDEPVESVSGLLPEIATSGVGTIVVDKIDVLERGGRSRYRTFLNDLQELLRQNGSVAFLYATRGYEPPPCRDTTEYLSDVLVDLELSLSETAVTRLAVPKNRTGSALRETLDVELTDEIVIDQSRDIA